MCKDTMEFIKNWIQHEHGILQENWIYAKNVSYHPYKSKNIKEVTAKNIFLSWYKEGNDYDYSQEHEHKNAGKLIDTRRILFIFNFWSYKHNFYLLLNK